MEGFRILEITQPSEVHVTANQLAVEQTIAKVQKNSSVTWDFTRPKEIIRKKLLV